MKHLKKHEANKHTRAQPLVDVEVRDSNEMKKQTVAKIISLKIAPIRLFKDEKQTIWYGVVLYVVLSPFCVLYVANNSLTLTRWEKFGFNKFDKYFALSQAF